MRPGAVGEPPSGPTKPRDWTSQLPPLVDAPPDLERDSQATPDRRDGAVYVMSDDLTLAVDVSLATRRPLLLRGEPGSGKSSLAAFIARNLNWRYYEHVVTARARARDLLYTFDSVRKLADASVPQTPGASLDDHRYIEPGVFWWAFDRASALRRGVEPGRAAPPPPSEPDAVINASRSSYDAVVLVDEIDKADPDLPNGLLVPLGSGEFRTLETGTLVTQNPLVPVPVPTAGDRRLLVIITTNEERDLPQAFVRRCVTHRLPSPGREQLVEIGRRHLRTEGAPVGPGEEALLGALAQRVVELRVDAVKLGRRPPSTAEFLDTARACRRLGVNVGDPMWERLERLVLVKDADAPEAGG
jgi:MoxR-like ATPase